MGTLNDVAAPGGALYLRIDGGDMSPDERYCSFAIEGGRFLIRGIRQKLFRTVSYDLMSIALADVREMAVLSDLSPYFGGNSPLAASSEVFKVAGTGLKKKNLYFVLSYRAGGAERRVIFGADYPGPAHVNLAFLDRLMASAGFGARR